MEIIGKLKSTITHPFIAGPLAGIFVVLMAYLDCKYRDVEREKSTYWKLFIVSSLIFSTVTYFISMEYNKTDEFLEQNYDTSEPSFYPKSKKKGGFLKKDQLTMNGPVKNIEQMMNSLPEP